MKILNQAWSTYRHARRVMSRITYVLRKPLVAVLMVAIGPDIAAAAAPQPSLVRVFPSGGQRGTQVEVTVIGANLGNVIAARFSGSQLSADVIEAKDANQLKLRVSIPSDAEIGGCDLRLLTSGGVSNRLPFVVGDLGELNEAEPNSERAQAQQIAALPCVVNGDISGEDQDFFRFNAKAGETFVFEVCGRRIRPYLKIDDRVGWFDPCLTLLDAAGNEIQFIDDFRDDPDPVLIQKFEQDGEYTIVVRDSLYRGRAEFVYRLRMGVLPFITHVYPLGWHKHSYAKVQVFGANLPVVSLFTIPAHAPPIHPVRVAANGVTSNALPFAVDDVSEVFESAENNTPETAQRVIAPVTVNGRMEKEQDQDYIVFAAAKGQRLIVEVSARQFGSPLDSFVQILNLQGGVYAANDDAEATPMQLHRADARLDFTVPADGDYFVRLRDFTNRGGDEFSYRLKIAPPQPRFELEVTPDNSRLEQNGSVALTVNMTRKDGFDSDVTLKIQDLPLGIVASSAKISKGQTSTSITLTATSDAPLGAMAIPLRISGHAAELSEFGDPMATGIESVEYVTSQIQKVPVADAVLALTPAVAPFSLSTEVPSVTVRKEQPQEVKVTVSRRPGIVGPVTLSMQGLPANVSVPAVTVPAEASEATLILTAAANAVVAENNILIQGQMTIENQRLNQITPAFELRVD